MTNNTKKRIYTSIILFLILFLMLIDNYILGFFLIVIGIISILEFFRMILKIFVKENIKAFLINCIYIIYIFVFCSALLVLSNYAHFKLLIFILLLTCIASDIGGFAVGKIIKGPKLTNISPKKTVSGAVGSIVLSILVVNILVFYFFGTINFNTIMVSIFTSVGCQMGDLFFSFLKRKAKIKDTGNILPGHGGVLDRLDGVFLGIPLGFITLIILY